MSLSWFPAVIVSGCRLKRQMFSLAAGSDPAERWHNYNGPKNPYMFLLLLYIQTDELNDQVYFIPVFMSLPTLSHLRIWRLNAKLKMVIDIPTWNCLRSHHQTSDSHHTVTNGLASLQLSFPLFSLGFDCTACAQPRAHYFLNRFIRTMWSSRCGSGRQSTNDGNSEAENTI